MKWVSNTYNPKMEDAKYHISCTADQTPQEAWEDHLAWLSGKFLGVPKASEKYTAAELVGMNMVGVYVEEGE